MALLSFTKSVLDRAKGFAKNLPQKVLDGAKHMKERIEGFSNEVKTRALKIRNIMGPGVDVLYKEITAKMEKALEKGSVKDVAERVKEELYGGKSGETGYNKYEEGGEIE